MTCKIVEIFPRNHLLLIFKKLCLIGRINLNVTFYVLHPFISGLSGLLIRFFYTYLSTSPTRFLYYIKYKNNVSYGKYLLKILYFFMYKLN